MDMALQRPTRLLRRSPLLPGESLESLLERLAVLNYYDPPGMLHRFCIGLTRGDRVPDSRVGQTYEQLAALTLVEPRDLYQATVHSFAPFLALPGTSQGRSTTLPGGEEVSILSEMTIRQYVWLGQRACFCPECLREAAYHRLAWMLVPAAVCLRHKCLLVARCPKCLELLSVRSVVHTRCVRCEADLLQASPLSVADDAFGLFTQRVIQAWLGLVPTPSSPWPHSLPDQSPQVLLRVIEGLRLNLPKAGDEWDHLHRVAVDPVAPSQPPVEQPLVTTKKMLPVQAYCMFATAFKGIVDWPDGFYEFLDAMRFRDGVRSAHSMYSALGALYSRWIEDYWKHPTYGFVQEAFDRYLAETYAFLPGAARLKRCQDNPDLGDRSQYVDLHTAARLLGVTTGTLARLVQLGRLTFHEAQERPSSKRRYRFFLRTDILALHEKWRDSMSLTETADRLGVSEEVVVAMVEEGLLKAERGPSTGDGVQWLFSGAVVEECVIQIAAERRYKSAAGLIDLTTAAKMLAVVGLNAAGVLRLVAERKLRGYWLSGCIENPGSLLFLPGSVELCVEAIRRKNGWVCRKDVAQRMRVKVCVVSRWVASGLLKRIAVCGSAHHFDGSEVKRFAADHVFSEEAAEMLDVGVLVVQKWARNGRLHPVAGPGVDECHRYLFRREEIERLRPENRLTAPQLAERLGISRSQMCAWIRQGRVQPVSGPGIDGCGQYLFVDDVD